MRTRFTPHRRPEAAPDPRLYGTRIDYGGVTIWGLVPDQDEATGAWLAFNELSGWWEPTATTGETTQNVLANGGWDNNAYSAPRYITVKGRVWGDDDTTVEAALDALAAALTVNERAPFVVTRRGVPWHVMARQDDQPEFTWTGADFADFSFSVSAADHRRLAGTGPEDGWDTLGPVTLPETSGGMSFPMSFPMVFTGETSTGRVVVPDGGTAPGDFVVSFAGPVESPGIVIVGTGTRLRFNLTVDAGQTLTINLGTHAVELNGVNRRSTMRGTWPEITGGQAVEFTAASFSPDATMTAQYRKARK